MAEVEQLLEDKYLFMKCVKGWEEEEDNYALFNSPAKKKGGSSKDDVAAVERLDTKQRIVPTRKARKKKTLKTSPKKETQKPKKDNKGKGKTDMTKIKCFNCGEMGHFPGTVRNPTKMLI